MNYDLVKFKDQLSQLQLGMTDEMEHQFLRYYEILVEWNNVMNLTSITEFDEVLEKHFLDSVSIAKYIDLTKKLYIIDVGTGAGFPGIPLKILYPNLHVLLADSLNKRVKFLNEVILQLNLKDINAVHGRAEELARAKAYRNQFDLCVSRAVANLASLSEYCLPFVKPGGVFAAYKSIEIDSEVEQSRKAIDMLGGKLIEVKKFQLPNTEYSRSIVMIENKERTAKKYPRKAGIPSKQPLGMSELC